MVFSSIPFLFWFFPATILLYLIAPKKLKNSVLLLASMVFYAWGERLLVLLFAFTILLGWLFGLLIEKKQGTVWAKVFLVIAVLIDLGLLGYFKYVDFFISSINSAIGVSIPLLSVTLPIGISFYTFQLLSYNVDVYRKDVKAQRNIIDFAAYVSMFPQLIAGPIVRYADIEGKLKNRTHSLELTAAGIRRFIIGMGKKILIANVLGQLCAQFESSAAPTVMFYWIYAIAFSLQIYFDFSGYSDMAIGLGKIFGFEFMENFNYPYISKSITEFWRRWHISLGSWFRDYVYIPLGGNRKGIARQIFNIFVVWMLTGLWHGAAWNFVLWGVFFAVLLIIEKVGFKKVLDKHPALGHVYALIAVVFGFVIFNCGSLAETGRFIGGMFGGAEGGLVSAETLYYLRSYAFVILAALIGATPLPKKVITKLTEKRAVSKVMTIAEPVALTVLLLVVTAYLVDGSFNPFLYFRF